MLRGDCEMCEREELFVQNLDSVKDAGAKERCFKGCWWECEKCWRTLVQI